MLLQAFSKWSEKKHGKVRSLVFDGALCATENRARGAQRPSINAVTGGWDREQTIMIIGTASQEPPFDLSVFREARHQVHTRSLHICKTHKLNLITLFQIEKNNFYLEMESNIKR